MTLKQVSRINLTITFDDKLCIFFILFYSLCSHGYAFSMSFKNFAESSEECYKIRKTKNHKIKYHELKRKRKSFCCMCLLALKLIKLCRNFLKVYIFNFKERWQICGWICSKKTFVCSIFVSNVALENRKQYYVYTKLVTKYGNWDGTCYLVIRERKMLTAAFLYLMWH